MRDEESINKSDSQPPDDRSAPNNYKSLIITYKPANIYNT